MDRVVECVLNVSEGRDATKIHALLEVLRSVRGVVVLDHTMDPDHHRAVLTLAGIPDAVGEAAFRAVRLASELIDLRKHDGVHPRVGATDVVPFVPLRGVTMEDCVRLAEVVGRRIGDELEIPVFFYERAATKPDHAKLETIRRGGLEGLKWRMEHDLAWVPDCGPPALHVTAGATVVGARPPLIAYNVNLKTTDLAAARDIARSVRESSGGLPGVKAMGVGLKSRGFVQVSMNLTNFEITPMQVAFEAVEREAHRRGIEVLESEVIGLVPEQAMMQVIQHVLKLARFDTDQILEIRLAQAMVQFASATDGSEEQSSPHDLGTSVSEILDAVSRPTPTLAGGSVAALTGTLAASLGIMVSRIGRSSEVEGRLEQLRSELERLIHEDGEAYAALLRAYKVPKDSVDRLPAIADARHTATEIPLQIGILVGEVARLIESLRQEAPSDLHPDLNTALFMARGAMEACLQLTRENNQRQENQLLKGEIEARVVVLSQSLERVRGLCYTPPSSSWPGKTSQDEG